MDSALTGAPIGLFPFLFGDTDARNHGSPDGSAGSCVLARMDVRDRDGHGDSSSNVSSPHIASVDLCDQVSLVAFTSLPFQNSLALGSAMATGFAPLVDSGSATIDLTADLYGTPLLLRPSLEGGEVRGLPVIGFEASNYINAHAQPGVLSNYSGLFQHRMLRGCAGAPPACS